jgi:hypothetical protein
MPTFTLNIQSMSGTTPYPVEVFNENTPLMDIMDYALEYYKGSQDPELPPIVIKPDQEIYFYFNDQALYPEDTLASSGIGEGGVVDIFIDSPVAAISPEGSQAPVVFDNRLRRIQDIEILRKMADLDENREHFGVKILDPFKLELMYKGVKGVRKLDGFGKPLVEDQHKVIVSLSAKYPIEKPVADCVRLSSLFHPNVNFEKGNICYATNWSELDADLCYVAIQVLHIIQFEPKLVNLDELDARMNEIAKTWFVDYRNKNSNFFPTDKIKFRNPRASSKQEWRNEVLQRSRPQGRSSRAVGPIGPMATKPGLPLNQIGPMKTDTTVARQLPVAAPVHPAPNNQPTRTQTIRSGLAGPVGPAAPRAKA